MSLQNCLGKFGHKFPEAERAQLLAAVNANIAAGMARDAAELAAVESALTEAQTDHQEIIDAVVAELPALGRAVDNAAPVVDKPVAEVSKDAGPSAADIAAGAAQKAAEAAQSAAESIKQIADTLQTVPAKTESATPAATGTIAPSQEDAATPAAAETPQTAMFSRSGKAPTFYSELARQVDSIKMNAAPAAQWKATIKGLTQKGVKQDESEWTGVNDWLDMQEGKVTREALLDYLNANGVRITETQLGGEQKRGLEGADADRFDELIERDELTPDEQDEIDALAEKSRRVMADRPAPTEPLTKFAGYQLPGGENYRELLLTLPTPDTGKPSTLTELPEGYDPIFDRSAIESARWGVTPPGQIHARPMGGRFATKEEAIAEALKLVNNQNLSNWAYERDKRKFRSSHFEQPNILAHIRFNERTDAEGKRVLFLEEIQSDWAQKGKKSGFDIAPTVTKQPSGRWRIMRGSEVTELPATKFATVEAAQTWAKENYKGRGEIPSAPFVTKTEAWVALSLKRMIRYAAENGFDRIAWTTGEQQTQRYDLSKQVKEISYEKTANGKYFLNVITNDGRNALAKEFTATELPDTVGKDVADKIIKGEGRPEAPNDPDLAGVKVLSGVDLKVGGEGMKTFYDKIVPNVASDVLKKLGGEKVGTVPLKFGNAPDEVIARHPNNKPFQEANATHQQPGFDITPALREKAMRGMPLFAKSDSATRDAGVSVADAKAEVLSELGRTKTSKIKFAASWADLPQNLSQQVFSKSAFDVQGMFDPETGDIWIVTGNIRKGEAFSVVMHEGGVHLGLEGLVGKPGVKRLADQIRNWARTGGSMEHVELARAAVARIPADTPIAQRDEETIAYFVQDAVAAGHGIPKPDDRGPIARWFRELWQAVRSAIAKLGLNPDKLTTDDIVALARGALERSLGARAGDDTGRGNFPTKSESSELAFARAGTAPVMTERVPGWAEGFTPAQQDALRKSGVIFSEATLQDRAKALTKDFGKKFVQGVLDQFAPLKELDQTAYMKARLSKATDGGVEALMLYGKPILRDGALDVDVQDSGFLKTLQSLKGEHDRFFAWVAGQRARELKAAGKENLLTDEDMSFLNTLNRGDAAWQDRQTTYQRALNELRAFNKAVMDIAAEQGIVDGESRHLWESQFYVPFYRVMEEGIAGPTVKSGLVRQYAFKKLKGGTENLNDLLKNTLMNWSHLLSAAQKNAAAKASIEAAERVGVAVEAPEETVRQMGKSIGQKNNVVWFMDHGRQRYFLVDDPYIMDAISSIEQANFGPWMKPLSALKRWLTLGVTVNPAFKIRNLIRDSIAAIGQNEISYNVWGNVVKGWKATDAGSQTRASLMAGGGMFRFGTMLEGDRAQHVKRLVEAGVDAGTILDSPDKIRSAFRKAWDAYQEFGDRSENINRAALYEHLIAKGHNHLEASFLARDMLDFGMSGKWAAVRFLTQVVPFMNARLQGLYKLGRAVHENPARAGYVTAAIALASLALLIGNEDDDDWKKREDWDRDTYWWFKFGGVAFRIPKPFELGAIGTIAERTYELAFNDEMTGKRFTQRMADIVSQNFSMSPVPQLVKPMIDLYANQDSFSGRPIETMGMENLRKQDRYSANTTYAARLIGQLGIPDPLQLMQGRYEGVSPVQADYLIRGYFGWLGTMTATALDYGIRPLAGAPAQPAMQLRDVFLAGNFVETLPTNQSRYLTELYEQSKEIEQAYNSWRHALKIGDVALARDIYDAERGTIGKYKQVEAVKRAEAKLTAAAHRIETSDADPDTKRMQLDALAQQKDRIARTITAAR